MEYVQTSFDKSIGKLSGGTAKIGGGSKGAVRTGGSGGEGRAPWSSYGQSLSRKGREEEQFIKEADPYGYEYMLGRKRIGENMRRERESRESERQRFFSGQAGPWGSAGQPRSEAQWRQSQFQRGTEEGQIYGRQQAEAYRGRGLEGDYRQTMQKWMENERRKPLAW